MTPLTRIKVTINIILYITYSSGEDSPETPFKKIVSSREYRVSSPIQYKK